MSSVSVIIPFVAENDYLVETLEALQKQTVKDFDVILLPNNELPEEFTARFSGIILKVITTGSVGPAQKRDTGVEASDGDIVAFIDDDAYPEPDWVEKALATFAEHKDCVGVGGPAITPASCPFWARVSGAVFLSKFSGGFPERYRKVGLGKYVDDWPSVNLLLKRDAFLAVGGFDSAFWPGEDTKLCHDVVAHTGQMIWYEPDLVVWHYRRASLRKHLRQVGNYGLHRGFFMKKFPSTSFRLSYLMPLFFALYLLLSISVGIAALAGVIPALWCAFFCSGWGVYAMALALAVRDILYSEPLLVALGALPYIFLTHLVYGVRTGKGLLSKSLSSDLGR